MYCFTCCFTRCFTPSTKGLQATFSEFDLEGNGTVTKRQFQKVFKDIDIALTKDEMDAVWKRFDRDDSGVVDFNEFMVFVKTEVVSPAMAGKTFRVASPFLQCTDASLSVSSLCPLCVSSALSQRR